MKLATLKEPMEFKSGEAYVTKAAGETVKVKELGQFTAACLANVNGEEVLFFCRPEDISLGTGEYMKENDAFYRKVEDGYLRVFATNQMVSMWVVTSIPFNAEEVSKEEFLNHLKLYKETQKQLNKLI